MYVHMYMHVHSCLVTFPVAVRWSLEAPPYRMCQLLEMEWAWQVGGTVTKGHLVRLSPVVLLHSTITTTVGTSLSEQPRKC